ncbi:MAG: PadR family transcriptional regulator [Actinomycetota bacterium]
MSVGMSLLAILEDGPSYGLQLKNEFETRTAGIWPLNVGQVYTTLGRLQRDGLVEVAGSDATESQKVYALTEEGREELAEWFSEPATQGPPSREELVLKLVMVARRGGDEAAGVIQAERRSAVQVLQEYTRLKRDTPVDGDLGWLFLLDSLIFSAEARVRWLDSCESRLRATPKPERAGSPASMPAATAQAKEVSA